uniref:Uncharacterized protein n=1 Tax=Trichuris muris TaxID=70415 RepID=A0A5S6QFH4_TRIMR
MSQKHRTYHHVDMPWGCQRKIVQCFRVLLKSAIWHPVTNCSLGRTFVLTAAQTRWGRFEKTAVALLGSLLKRCRDDRRQLRFDAVKLIGAPEGASAHFRRHCRSTGRLQEDEIAVKEQKRFPYVISCTSKAFVRILIDPSRQWLSVVKPMMRPNVRDALGIYRWLVGFPLLTLLPDICQATLFVHTFTLFSGCLDGVDHCWTAQRMMLYSQDTASGQKPQADPGMESNEADLPLLANQVKMAPFKR